MKRTAEPPQEAAKDPKVATAPAPVPAPKRRRVMNRACFFCRKDHKACDTKRPCERCISLNNADACMLADRIIPPVQRTKKLPPPPTGAFNPFGGNKDGASRATEGLLPTPQLPNAHLRPHNPPPQASAVSSPLLTVDGCRLLQEIVGELKSLSHITNELRQEQQSLKEKVDQASNPLQHALDGRDRIPPEYSLVPSYFSLPPPLRLPPAGLPNRSDPQSFLADYFRGPNSSFLCSPSDNMARLVPAECWDVTAQQSCVIEDVTKPFAVFRPFQVSAEEYEPKGDYVTNFGYLRVHRIAVNDSFCNFVNYSRPELLQTQPKLDLVLPKHRKYVSPIHLHFFRDTKHYVSPVIHMTPKWRIRDGSIWPSIARAQMFYNEEGYTSFFIVCVDAVTERRIPRYLGPGIAGNKVSRIEEVPRGREDSPALSPSSSTSESEGDTDGEQGGRGIETGKALLKSEESHLMDLFLVEDATPSFSSSSPSSPFTDPLVEVEELARDREEFTEW